MPLDDLSIFPEPDTGLSVFPDDTIVDIPTPELEDAPATTQARLSLGGGQDDVTQERTLNILKVLAEMSGIPAIFRSVTSVSDQLLPGTPLADAWTSITGRRPRQAKFGDFVVAGITLMGGAGLRGATMLLRGVTGTAAKRVAQLSDDVAKGFAGAPVETTSLALGRLRFPKPIVREGTTIPIDPTIASMEEVSGVIKIATESLAANQALGDPVIASNVNRIFQYLADSVKLGLVSPDDLPKVMAEYGIKSADEAAILWSEAIKTAASAGGRILGQLSAAQRQLALTFGKYLKPETLKKLEIDIVDPSLWSKLRSGYIQPLIQIWRSGITSQLSTSNRNWEIGIIRMPLQTFDDAMTNLGRDFARASGVRATNVHAMENMAALMRNMPTRGREKMAKVVETFATPVMRRQLDSVYYGMVTGPADPKTMTLIQRFLRPITNGMQIFNRSQEYWVRRMSFDAKWTQGLARLGIKDEAGMMLEVKRIGELSRKAAEQRAAGQAITQQVTTAERGYVKRLTTLFNESAEHALQHTFALTPKRNPVLAFYNKIPEAALIHPFPRFLINSLDFITKHSPVGLAKYATKAQRQALVTATGIEGAADIAAQSVGKMVTGSLMFGAGVAARHSPAAGEKWYQLRMGNRTIDTRPFNPLAAYMLLGEVIRQMADPEATQVRLTPSDFADALLGIRRLTGTGLFIFDAIAKDSPTAFQTSLENFAREFIGGFTIPFRNIKDVVAGPASKDERVYRETREGNIFSSAVGNLPFIPKMLGMKPRAKSTRERPAGIEPDVFGVIPTGAFRQLTGISFRGESGIEREFNRLNINPNPRTGDVTINRLISEQMGPDVERRMERLVSSPSYMRLGDFEKKERLNRELSRIKKRAKSQVLRTERPRIIEDLTKELQAMSIDRARMELRKRRNAGFINAEMERTIVRNLLQSGVR